MAQLSNDCFALGGGLLTVAAALCRDGGARLLGCRHRDGAVGGGGRRILARDVIATMNLPPHANSAVDGYAVATPT